jgi:hypothetical protein
MSISGDGMLARNSLFVDTSGWTYLVDQHDPFHRKVRTAYRRALAQKRAMITSNYRKARKAAVA